ncbi:hypothetical protein BGX26_012844 [Mortierella sp. AD094]|nr:hypothetical protein BGX26_012844 [Mortierella sp. AD094]
MKNQSTLLIGLLLAITAIKAAPVPEINPGNYDNGHSLARMPMEEAGVVGMQGGGTPTARLDEGFITSSLGAPYGMVSKRDVPISNLPIDDAIHRGYPKASGVVSSDIQKEAGYVASSYVSTQETVSKRSVPLDGVPLDGVPLDGLPLVPHRGDTKGVDIPKVPKKPSYVASSYDAPQGMMSKRGVPLDGVPLDSIRVRPLNVASGYDAPKGTMSKRGVPLGGVPLDGFPLDNAPRRDDTKGVVIPKVPREPSYVASSYDAPRGMMSKRGVPLDGVPLDGIRISPLNVASGYDAPQGMMPKRGVPLDGVPLDDIPYHGYSK